MNEEMATAYSTGLADGNAGLRRGRPNDFEACYEQGWQHGKRECTIHALGQWDAARRGMQECLNEENR